MFDILERKVLALNVILCSCTLQSLQWSPLFSAVNTNTFHTHVDFHLWGLILVKRQENFCTYFHQIYMYTCIFMYLSFCLLSIFSSCITICGEESVIFYKIYFPWKKKSMKSRSVKCWWYSYDKTFLHSPCYPPYWHTFLEQFKFCAKQKWGWNFRVFPNGWIMSTFLSVWKVQENFSDHCCSVLTGLLAPFSSL